MFVNFTKTFHPTRAEQINDLENVIQIIKKTDYKNNYLYCKHLKILDNSLYSEPFYMCKINSHKCNGKCKYFLYNQSVEKLEEKLVNLKK